jgi:hypothetical protein
MIIGFNHFLGDRAVTAETDRPRILLCVPYWCGLNDVLVQIWKSYKYARATNRHLLIDTRVSGFWDDFDNYFMPTAATQAGPIPIVGRVSDQDIKRLNQRSTYPAARQGQIEFCHRQIELRCAGDHLPSRWQRAAAFAANLCTLPPSQNFADTIPRRMQFIADVALQRLRSLDNGCTLPRDEEVVVHHRSGGGQESFYALKLLTLTEPVRAAVRQALSTCGDDFDAIHIRNTDIRTDYRTFLSQAASRLSGRRVLVCSDDLAVILAAKDLLTASQVFTVTKTEDSGGQPLHKLGVSRDGADRRRLNTNMLVDLLCLASSRALLITSSQPQCCNSGFSGLAKLLHEHPNLINQLVGTTNQSWSQPPVINEVIQHH